MTTNASHLLRRLEPPIRPVDAPSTRSAPTAPNSLDFRQWLNSALSGRGAAPPTGRQVSLEAANLTPLSSQQLSRLSLAADIVEQAGANRALALLDDRALVLDVESRMVIDELAADDTRPSLPIPVDVAIRVPDPDQRPRPLGPPAADAISRSRIATSHNAAKSAHAV